MRIQVVILLSIFYAFELSGQTRVSGKITDSSTGESLIGATILYGKGQGTATDFDGNYSITASVGDVLVFSYVGFETKTVTVGRDTNINILLNTSNQLDEVVVTSLGISRAKKSLGYAVTELKSDEVNTVKDHNVANSLAGKVAGVNITTSGSMGAGSRILIRGNNSLSGNTQALIVVDGIPINADGTNAGGSVYNNRVTGGGISDINASDIETISILKGPNSAALYGSRAGNGVILITTKKGTKDTKLGITLNTNTTMDDLMDLPSLQNEYGQGSAGAYPIYIQEGGVNIGVANSGSWGAKMDGSAQPYFLSLIHI